MRRAHRRSVAWAFVFALVAVFPACRGHERPEPPEATPSPTLPAAADPVPSSLLTADVAARVAAARTRFGESTRTTVVGDLFVLVENGPPQPFFERMASELDTTVRRLVKGHLRRLPDTAVTIVVFTAPHAYRDYAEPFSGADRFYEGDYRSSVREIDVDGSRGARHVPPLTRSIVFPLVEADFPGAPLWFRTGLANLFEAPIFSDDGTLHGAARDWRNDPAEASLFFRRENSHLDALFGMPDETFDRLGADAGAFEAVSSHHALARSVAAWMDANDTLWPFYRAWRDGFANDPTGTKAFAAVVGATPRERDAEWARWAF